jgi:hypothetical protein
MSESMLMLFHLYSNCVELTWNISIAALMCLQLVKLTFYAIQGILYALNSVLKEVINSLCVAFK